MADENGLAYEAGRALPSVQFPPDFPEGLRHLGLHHCPFSKTTQPEQYEAYARGLRDALGGDATDRANLLQQLDDVVEVGDAA